MKHLRIVIALLIAIPFINSCKKGEDDPFISLRSRTARLSGEWTVSTATIESKQDSIVQTINFSNNNVTSYLNGEVLFKTTYKWTYEINDDGTYKMETLKNYPDNSTMTLTQSGKWYFLNSNDSEGVKNKELVAFQNCLSNINTTTSTVTKNNVLEVFRIVELRNKKIRLVKVDEITHKNQYMTESGCNRSEMTLTPIK